MYVLQAAPETRPGIGVANSIKTAWIRVNRIWDTQDPHTQTQAVWLSDEARCQACRIEDNGP
jgi:hypothetical protein